MLLLFFKKRAIIIWVRIRRLFKENTKIRTT